MFSHKRPATRDELLRLTASLDVDVTPGGLREAQVSEVTSSAELGQLRTVLRVVHGAPALGREYTVAELAEIFMRGGGDAHDQRSFGYALGLAADAQYVPTLLLEPNGHDWWLIDGIHRAAAVFASRQASGTDVPFAVFVLPRPLT